ncbi:MAG: flagellar basal-body rod protein FlgG [Pseudomonadota bacterium]
MIRAMWSAASGMTAQQLNIDVIANNLANVNTTGFKRSRADFQDLMYQTLRQPGATTASGSQVPTGIQVGMGTKPAAVQKIFSQGDYTETGNDLDLAIEGKGFFLVQSNGEDLYTRAGAFKLDKDAYVCTSDGDRLQPEFSVPSGSVKVSVDSGGMMSATSYDGTEAAAVQLQIYDFPNPAGLQSIGRGLYRPTAASGDAAAGQPSQNGMGTIMQRSLEMSNVSVVEEMVQMIVGQRAYEVSSKAIQTADEMLQLANNVRR